VGALLAFLLLGAGTTTTQGVLAAAPVQTAVSPGLSATDPNLPTSLSASGNVQALSPVFRPEVLYWSNAIQSWAASAGLDPNLVATVMQIESCGDPRARSGAGAMGLFQVMPYHFATGENPYDPDTNAARGMDYLKRSLAAANGNPRLALAGYNGGIGVIGRAEYSWSGQTQRYAYWGSGIYAEASSGSAVSPRLQEWYTTSGASLCHQAHDRLGITP
jgi:soluble lytic murein transglycosylase-like protein